MDRPDAYNLHSAYGLQSWDGIRIQLVFVYQPLSTKASMASLEGFWWLVHRAVLTMAADYERSRRTMATFWLIPSGGGQAWASRWQQQRLFLLRERYQHVRSGIGVVHLPRRSRPTAAFPSIPESSRIYNRPVEL